MNKKLLFFGSIFVLIFVLGSVFLGILFHEIVHLGQYEKASQETNIPIEQRAMCLYLNSDASAGVMVDFDIDNEEQLERLTNNLGNLEKLAGIAAGYFVAILNFIVGFLLCWAIQLYRKEKKDKSK